MLLAQAVETRITLDAFLGVNRGPMDARIDIDGPDRTHISAISARNALARVDLYDS